MYTSSMGVQWLGLLLHSKKVNPRSWFESTIWPEPFYFEFTCSPHVSVGYLWLPPIVQRLTGDAKRTIGVKVNGCLSPCVSPAID